MSGGQSAFACLPRALDPHHIASVKASTFRCYQQCLRLFVIFLIESGANPGSAAEPDFLTLQYKASCHLSHSKLTLYLCFRGQPSCLGCSLWRQASLVWQLGLWSSA